MNVLHVIEGINSKLGGLPNAMFSIRQIEERLNIYSHILSIVNDDTIVGYSNTYHLFPPSFPKRFYRSSSAMDWLENNIDNYDLIVIHGFWNFLCLQTALTAINRHKRYIIWPHGSLDPFDLQKKKFLKKIVGFVIAKKIIINAYKICFTSLQESLSVETYGAIINKTVLPLSVDSVHHKKNSDSSLRIKYGIQPNDFVFLFLGRINYKKKIDLLIDVFQMLYFKHKQIKLIVAGYNDTDYGKLCKNLVSSYGLDKVIIFCGELVEKEKANGFYGCDCFVLPSLNENFGIATVEALQHGLPVVVSDKVYICKEIEDLQGGWVCEANKVSLSTVMEHVILDKIDYIQKKASAKKAGNYFLPENLIVHYEKFYNDII